MVSVRRRAMACEFEVQLAAARNDDSMEHVFAALDLVEVARSANDRLSRRQRSDPTSIAARPTKPVAVEPRLFGLLAAGRTASSAKRMARSISRAARSRMPGAFRAAKDACRATTRSKRPASALACSTSCSIAREQTIAFRQPGMSINLNSMGKGYALDRMAELLAANDVDDYPASRRQEQRAGARRSAGLRRNRLAGRRPAPAASGRAAGRICAARSGPLDLRRRHAVLHPPRPAIRPHSRSAHRPAGRRAVFRDRHRPDRGRGRGAFDRVLRDGTAESAASFVPPDRKSPHFWSLPANAKATCA